MAMMAMIVMQTSDDDADDRVLYLKFQLGTIAHEIGHALGFHHEQARPDRDDYVTIHYDNINPSNYVNFMKYNSIDVASHDIPYDYNSVMHYGGYVSIKT